MKKNIRAHFGQKHSANAPFSTFLLTFAIKTKHNVLFDMKSFFSICLMIACAYAGINTAWAQRFSRDFSHKYDRHSPSDVCRIRSNYAGHLKEKITEKDMRQARIVIIAGDINGDDIAVLRKLCSRVSCSDANGRSVENYVDLDLSGARILSGGAYYSTYRCTRDEIGENMFSQCSALRSIVLPEWTTYIHKRAFASCSRLEDVMMPRGVRGIDNEAFRNCKYLSIIDLPEGIERIGNEAFYGCDHLAKVNLPQSLKSIGSEAFRNCPFTAIRLPHQLQSIGSNAFSYTKLTEIEIPATARLEGSLGYIPSLSQINVAPGSEAYTCENGILYSQQGTTLHTFPMGKGGAVNVPQGVRRIGSYAFSHSKVSSVILPESIEEIGKGAFSNCSALTSCHLPESLGMLKDATFDGCTRLQQVNLPHTLTDIGIKAFHNCESLREISLPEGLKSIGSEAFRNCKSLTQVAIPAGVTTLAYKVFNECHALTHITLAEGLTVIEESALDNCNLSELVIPSTVNSIGKKMVEKNRNLQKIEVRAARPPELKSDSEKKVPLYVPEASIELYRNAKNWKNYKTILPIKP